MHLRITDEGGTWWTTLESFVAANHEDAETVAALRALDPGASVVIGGGAVPEVTVYRPTTAQADARADAAAYVAHVVAAVFDGVERVPGGWLIEHDDMHQLRAALGAWERSGDALVAAQNAGESP